VVFEIYETLHSGNEENGEANSECSRSKHVQFHELLQSLLVSIDDENSIVRAEYPWYHMYVVVQSADARPNLSSIEILWYLGKNCTSFGTVHIIHPPCVSMKNQSYRLSIDPHVNPHAVSHVCCAERRRPFISLLH
jgi:hypothetical protein